MSYSPLGMVIVAGLDTRFGWSPLISGIMSVVASVIVGLGWLIYLWALSANRFFSAFVRIQTDRGHTVVTTGPYRLVRHPGYTGALLVYLATPIMLGSWWALTAAALIAGATLVRTALEDKTLQIELTGYPDYARQVRFRLLRSFW